MTQLNTKFPLTRDDLFGLRQVKVWTSKTNTTLLLAQAKSLLGPLIGASHSSSTKQTVFLETFRSMSSLLPCRR